MALVSTSGAWNVESDVALASTSALTASRWGTGKQVRVGTINVAPISTAAGAQCGHIALRDGTTVVARFYVFFTATAASQAQTFSFPMYVDYIPATSLNVLYTAVTDATTASASFTWQ